MAKRGCENYTYKDEYGNMITVEDIPTSEVVAIMRNLDIGHREAVEVWCYDNDKMGNAEAEALTAKAKAAGTMNRNTSGKRKAPTRKPDETKRALIKMLAEALAAEADIVTVEKVERLITFTIGDDSYKLTLSKDRKPKA